MRVGQNPARFVKKVPQPAPITVAVVNCIPFLSGYYAQSLDVLRATVESLDQTREAEHPYDVMVFDNRSCVEVRAYLQQAYAENKIQYLVLSDKNIGKIGAWNFMFGAAPGKYVAFADADVYFRPGWLSASLELFEAFPKVGMVTARPLRTPMEFSSATLQWAQQANVLEEGQFLAWETYWEHVQSLGMAEIQARKRFEEERDYRLQYQGKTAFVGAVHFQFLVPAEVLKKIIPLPSQQPMRGERALDIAINQMGLLRLTTAQALICHMGNRLPLGKAPVSAKRPFSLISRLVRAPLIRKPLLWLYDRIFELYFAHVE